MQKKQIQSMDLWRDDKGVHINAHGGGLLHHGGLYYWFGEHKIEGDAGNAAHVGVHAYSSSDLVDWKDEGIALAVDPTPGSPIVPGCLIERPKVIHNPRTGKFVMWFHHELPGKGYDSALSGVAVADRPAGPYTYLGSQRQNAGHWPSNVPDDLKVPLTAKEKEELAKVSFNGGDMPNFPADLLFRRDFAGGQMARDMTLFVDDDGTAYHIYSSEENGTLHVSQLRDDFLGASGRYARILPGKFNEAPALLKRDGTYFLFSSGTTGWKPNPARLASAPSIWGPWTHLGNPCQGSEEDRNTTFDSQSTFIQPVPGKKDAYIFMADSWRPENAIDGRYVWLPVRFQNDVPYLEQRASWDLDFFS